MLPFIHVAGHAFATYGVMMGTGMFVAFYVLRADMSRRHLALQPLPLISAICATGFVSSKLYLLVTYPALYWAHPARLLNPSGYAFYGAVIGGVGVVCLLARVYRTPALKLFDAVSAAAALGYGFGRLGCFLAGDGDYGTPTSLPWGMSFPHGLAPTLQTVHPTPLYEIAASIAITVYLWRLGRPSRRPMLPTGTVFAAYLLLTGVARFLVEFIRLNPRVFYGLSNAQLVALASIAGGALLLLLSSGALRPRREPYSQSLQISDVSPRSS